MENKDQNPLVSGANGTSMSDGGALHEPPPDPNALSLDPATTVLVSQEQPRPPTRSALAKRLAIALIILLLLMGIGASILLINNRQQQRQDNANLTAAGNFDTIQIPLDELVSGKNMSVGGAANVTINGELQLSSGVYLLPSLQPTGARPGQIYFDQGTNQLAYFNGEGFVFLTSPSVTPGALQSLSRVESIGGATGQLTLGGGLSVADGQLSNSGVLSVQGQSGDIELTAGPGIVINGTTFSNSGVVSIAAGTPNVTVGNDGSGNVTIGVTGGGTGTVTSSGGTAGVIPLFTGSQNIENSIITQSGLTVTITGDLSVVTGGLSLSTALTVSNGGTGATSLAANGVLIGNGTAPITSVPAGGPGLCLISTAGTPTWAACPGGGGVLSLNGLTGALSIANASAAGSTITIDDASATNKGIASFNGTNFNVSGGAVNTVQDINTTATPTFTGVNTNTITPNAPLTVGVSAQTALLQGSTTTITSNGAGNNIILNSAGTIELQDNTNVTGNITTSGDLAVNGGDLTSAGALNITPGGTLTIGSPSQTLTLQGGAATTFRATSGGNTTVIGFTTPLANTTLNFPALAAGTYTICTTSGNCAGAAATLQSAYDNSTSPEIVLDATRGALTIRDNATPLGGNLLEVQNNAGSATYLAVTSSGAAITGTAVVSGNVNSTAGAIQTNGTTRIDNGGNAVNIGNVTLSGAISGGTTYTGSGNINTTGGGLQTNSVTRVDNSGNLINIGSVTASGNATFQGGSLTLGGAAQVGAIVLNDGSSNTGTLQVAPLAQNTVFTLPDPGTASATICLTTGNCAGTGGGVTTGGGTTNRLAKFTGSQAIGDSSISDDGTNVTVAVDVIIQGGDLNVGTTSQAASIILNDGTGQTTTLQAGNSTGNLTFVLPTNSGTANQCLKQSGVGNQLVWQDCDGGSGGSSATLQTAYNNSLNPEIVLNSSVGGLTIRDNATPLGTNLFEIQNNAGSTTYFNVMVSGIGVTGTATASGNINTTGGGIQTNGTTRIDNSGNMVNIGNITGSGPITVASVGAGNDITIDGADQFIVQDASVFNALATFNANLDIGANSIIGTTGDINLTNFDVDGDTGNVTAAGTINGQTISNAANFTGTVTVASDMTLGGDLAVNGGDLTSAGALNITPGGTLTMGATGQQLILQGNGSTQLTATDSGFTTTIGFTGTPTGNVTYNFDQAAAPGAYTICTSIGNCAGAGGGVTTSGGTVGTLAKFTGAQTLGDSLLSESGSTVTVNGNLNLTSGNQYRINGTQISSADLSNDANLAKLSASQTFTGNTNAFQNTANSTNAFNVQNAGGTRLLTADTTNGQIVLGAGSALDGKLVFNNVSNNNTMTILPGTPTANRTLTLPDASGVICTDSGNCAGAGATLQTAYNFSVGGTTPKIKLNSTLLGIDIQDADTTIGANLFNIRASDAGGLGAVMFGVGNTGQITMQNSANSTTALRLLTAGGTAVLTGDTTNGQILLGQSGTLSGSLVFRNATNTNTITIATSAPAANRTITLPDATGTVCLTTGNCASVGGGVTTAGGTTNRLPVFNGAQTLADSWLLQNTSTLELDSTRNLSLLGGNFSVTGNATVTGTYNTNTFTANTLQFGAASTATISSAASQALNITSNAAATWSTTNGNLNIQAQGNLNLGNGGGQTINIGTNNAQHTITIGNQGATGTQIVTIGSSGNVSNSVSIESGSSGTLNIGAGATAHTINIGSSNSAVQNVTLGSTNGASNTTIQAGTGNLNLVTNASTASIIARSNTNSATAFQIQNSSAAAIFNVDTVANLVSINQSLGSGTLALDVRGGFQQTGMTTPNTGASGGGQWTKLGVCTIDQQFEHCFAVLQIVGGYEGNISSNTQAMVAARVKQQAALGGAPLVNVTVSNTTEVITKDDLAVVITQNDATATVAELWGRVTNNFERWHYAPLVNTDSFNNLWSWTPNTTFQAVLPTGTQTIARYGNSYANTLTVRPSSDATGVFQVQNAAGASVLRVDTTTARVAIGGSFTPQQALDVVGNIQVRDASTATKAYRLRTSGSALDLEAGGADAMFSVWTGADFTGTQRNYLRLQSGAHIAQAIGSWQFKTSSNGTTRHTIDGTAGANVTFNQNGEATDFTVQGDTATSLLFVQGSTDRIGIGTVTPGSRLDIQGASTGDALNVSNATSTGNIATFKDNTTTVLTLADGGAALYRNSTNSTGAFDVQDQAGDSMLTVNTTNKFVIIGQESGTVNGANAAILMGDTCGLTLQCISISEGQEINDVGTGDTDVLQLQGGGGIRFSTDYSISSRMIINAAGNVGIGTENPSERLTIQGNLSASSADGTKSFRVRNSGGSLDLEVSGVGGAGELWISGWTGANFTGTQVAWFRLNADSRQVLVGNGTASATPVLLVVAKKSSASGGTDPGGMDGAIYYNESLSKFRCHEGGGWKNCIPFFETTGVSSASAGGSTTSGTYVNMPATSSLAYTKRSNTTKLHVSVNATLYSSAINTAARLGVMANAADNDCGQMYFNNAAEHHQVTCDLVISGLPAGTGSVQLRWRRVVGTGTLSMDTQDWVSIMVRETE